MGSQRIILLTLRAVLLLAAAVVLGTSADLVGPLNRLQDACDALYKDEYCNLDGLIPALGYSCFAGALGLVAALAGIAACFLDAIPDMIMMAVDAFTALAMLAGGIAISVILSKPIYKGGNGSTWNEIKADAAFGVIGGLVSIALVVVGFLWRGRGKGSSSV